ncbi:MAG: hypothetical protein RR301_12550, partial [Clostridia bacterium]
WLPILYFPLVSISKTLYNKSDKKNISSFAVKSCVFRIPPQQQNDRKRGIRMDLFNGRDARASHLG